MTAQPQTDLASRAPDDTENVNRWIGQIRSTVNEHRWTNSEIIRAISESRAPREAIRRWAMEYHHYSTIATSNAFILLANAPDRQTYAAWGRNMAGELGYLDEPEHLTLLVELLKQLGSTEIASFIALPATLAQRSPCLTTSVALLRKVSRPVWPRRTWL